MNPPSTTVHRVTALLCLSVLPGCERAGYRSPSVDLLGSYFPAWMISIIAGLVLTLILRLLFAALKLAPELRPAALVHLCLWVLLTLGTWLMFFRN